MSNSPYKFIIDDMKWSYSRVSTYDDCPYKWYQKYILEDDEEQMFYASYGSFMHDLLEQFYKGKLTKDEMLNKFLCGFSDNVVGERPQESIVEKYIKSGVEYIKNFTPFDMNTIAVEKWIEFDIGKYHFHGRIDYFGEKDGDYYLIDHKSRDLKPRSNRSKPTQKDAELDSMLEQLYIYSTGIKKIYGEFPDYLCFNCFKNNVFIKEPFDIDKYYHAVKNMLITLDEIEHDEEFLPHPEFFHCKYLCGFKDCCYGGK